MHESTTIQDTNPLKQSKVNELSNNSPLTTSLGHRIPIKQFHNTTLEKIIENRKLDVVCQEINDNNISFYAPRQEPERAKSMNTRRIASLHGWKQLQVSVKGFIEIKNSSLQTLDYLVGKGFYKLKQLRLKFVGCSWFNDQHLKEALSYVTRNLQQTQKLAIIVSSSPGITNSGLKQAGSLIVKNLPNLRSLRYDIFLCANADGTSIVSKLTRNLPKLKKLFLNFGGTNQTNSSITWTTEKISKNLVNLEHLRLYFWDAQALTDNGLITFACQICQNLTRLKSLYLNFRSCGQLSATGTDALLREINNNLVNLKSLALIIPTKGDYSYVNSVGPQILEKLPGLEISSTDDYDDMNYHH